MAREETLIDRINDHVNDLSYCISELKDENKSLLQQIKELEETISNLEGEIDELKHGEGI